MPVENLRDIGSHVLLYVQYVPTYAYLAAHVCYLCYYVQLFWLSELGLCIECAVAHFPPFFLSPGMKVRATIELCEVTCSNDVFSLSNVLKFQHVT